MKLCKNCNAEFIPPSGRSIYCSRSCRSEWDRANRKRECSFSLCNNKVLAKSLCSTHYDQMRRGVELRTVDHYRAKGGLKICSSCDAQKPVVEFHKASTALDGLSPWCKECTRWRGLLRKHSITRERWFEIYEAQGRSCGNPGCGETENLYVDHDHSCCPSNRSCGECIRGLLCNQCNTALGLVQDNTERIKGLVSYLSNGQDNLWKEVA